MLSLALFLSDFLPLQSMLFSSMNVPARADQTRVLDLNKSFFLARISSNEDGNGRGVDGHKADEDVGQEEADQHQQPRDRVVCKHHLVAIVHMLSFYQRQPTWEIPLRAASTPCRTGRQPGGLLSITLESMSCIQNLFSSTFRNSWHSPHRPPI